MLAAGVCSQPTCRFAFFNWLLNCSSLTFPVPAMQALLYFQEDTTGDEAYRLVRTTNAIMHFMWGAHNLHQFYIAVSKVCGVLPIPHFSLL